jgi:hypothetical protein
MNANTAVTYSSPERLMLPPAISAPAPASRATVSWEETEVAASELRATACRLKSRNEEEESWLTSQTPPLIWSEEAVTPLVVKSMNWMEEISVSIFSSWVSKLVDIP